MKLEFLDFEQPIAELEAKIEELRYVTHDGKINISEEIFRLEGKIKDLTESIFSSLTPRQIVKLARHPNRPHSSDYIERIFTGFDEFQGDRHCGCGRAIISGTCRLEGQPVMVIGQQKGRSTKENLERNFGMPNPEDYRKALRMMKMAEKFCLPVITLIDTAGAYPGVDAEEHNQSEAIAMNLIEMSQLQTPMICVVIGEGGSGGALALGVGDRTLMLQYSIYSVISPEGCSSILWRSQERVDDAAAALKLTAKDLRRFNIIDEIVQEPLGGAHRDFDLMAKTLKSSILRNLDNLQSEPISGVVDRRYDRLMAIGRY